MRIMSLENDVRIRHFERHLPEFVKRVDAVELIPYLYCLTQSSREEIENRQIQKSRREAANILYQHLTRMDNWWPQLLEGLRSTRQDKLAAMLSEIDKEIGPPRKSRQQTSGMISTWKEFGRDTSYKYLPYSVTWTLKIMDSDDVTNNWKALAALFGYTTEDVTRLHCNKLNASCTEKLLAEWGQKEDSTLHNLLVALKKLERIDLLAEVQRLTGYILPDNKIPECQIKDDPKKYDWHSSRKNSTRCQSNRETVTTEHSGEKFPPRRTGDANSHIDDTSTTACPPLVLSKTPEQEVIRGDNPLWQDNTTKDCHVTERWSRPTTEIKDKSKDNYQNRTDMNGDGNINNPTQVKTMKDKVVELLPVFGGIAAIGAALAFKNFK